MKKPLFITGIGTGVGKTLVSAVLTEYLQADYWKPVQAGDLGFSDSDRVQSLLTNTKTCIHPEQFRLKMAASPHEAAAEEGIEIKKSDFSVPSTNKCLLIEGAGGLMVPLNKGLYMVDLIHQFNAEAVLVLRDYLGCINHSLLSYTLLCQHKIKVYAIVFNGAFNQASIEAILQHIDKEISILYLPEIKQINKESIYQISKSITI